MFADPMVFKAWQTGLFASAGLIMAIGTQNAFLLSKALRRQHPIGIAAICAVIDASLITLGVLGLGALVKQSPMLLEATKWFGGLFLICYGLFALCRAFKSQVMTVEDAKPSSFKLVFWATLAVSLLNPHVYLDTVLLIGSIGGQFEGAARTAFIIGASTASMLWFFSLAWGAQRLTPLFAKPIAWRCLDILVCLIMWALAYQLLTGKLTSGL